MLLGASLAALTARPFLAQGGYPDRPIRMVVGYAPGGGVDIVARLVGGATRNALGQVPVVEKERVIERLSAAIAAGLRESGPRAKLDEQGAVPLSMPRLLCLFVAEETRRFTRIIEDGGITADL
jgi:hypothetical protein